MLEMGYSESSRWIHHAEIDIALPVTPISGKRDGFPARTKESKSEDKDNDLSAAFEAGTEHIVKLEEPLRLVSAGGHIRSVRKSAHASGWRASTYLRR